MAREIKTVRIGGKAYERWVNVRDDAVKPSPAPSPEPEVKKTEPEKTLLEKAAEVVEEAVKPKRRGRPKKKPAAEQD